MNGTAIRLTEQVVLVGSGEIGLSEAHDSHVYLIDAGSGYLMVDCGAGIEPEKITKNIQGLDVNFDSIKYILITHGHADHAGGAWYFHSMLNAYLCAGEKTATLLSRDDEKGISLDIARMEGIYPSNFKIHSVELSKVMHDGDRLKVGDCIIEVLETPGHSADSTCYLISLDEGPALFCGDTILANGTLTLLNTSDSDLQKLRDSIDKLSAFDFDGLYPGHGTFQVREGSNTVKQLHQRLKTSIFLPPVMKG